MSSEGWAPALEVALRSKLLELSSDNPARPLRRLDVGVFPWHRLVALSCLFHDEDARLEVPAWTHYDASRLKDGNWTEAVTACTAMEADWRESQDSTPFLRGVAALFEAAGVREALEQFELTEDFELTLFDPDDDGSLNFCADWQPSARATIRSCPAFDALVRRASRSAAIVAPGRTLAWADEVEDHRVQTRAALRNVRSFMGVPLRVGRPLTGSFPGAQIAVHAEHPPADYFPVGPLEIVSDRLRGVLERFRVGAEFLPARVSHRGAPYAAASFFCLNVLDRVDCLDREASHFDDVRGYATRIRRCVIDEGRTSGKHLFRLDRAVFAPILVSGSLAAAIEESGASGVRFVDPASVR